MAVVDIDKAIETATEIIQEAHRSHKLESLSKRLIRQNVEQRLQLETGALEEYKEQLSEAIASAIEKLGTQDTAKRNSGEKPKKLKQGEPVKSVSSVKKRKPLDSGEAVEAKKSKKRAAAIESNEDAESIEATPEAKGKKRKSSGSTTEKGVSKAISKTIASEDKKKSFKSRDVIESDDENNSGQANLASAPSVSSKGKGKRMVLSDTEDESESVISQKKRKKPETLSLKADSPKKTLDTDFKTIGNDTEGDIKSDSELSVLLDGPPTIRGNESAKPKAKPRKSKENTKEKKPRGKKEGKEMSPDEEQIKKLKSLIVACGVRKVWSKELKDCETPSREIAHLRGMLTELGMKGRFSLEQAKSIKAKRDLAKEMEDVVEFAQRHSGSRPKRAAATAQKEAPVDVDASSDEEGNEADHAPSRRPKPKNAHRSIMAFLGDQSDED